jgi:cryptochrome
MLFGCFYMQCTTCCVLNVFARFLQGGESQALLRLEDYLADSKWVCSFEKPKTDPSAFIRPATTVLSPYLKFGCLSPRLFHQRLMAVYRASKGVHSKPPVSLRGQLLWREFFYTVRGAQL